MLVLVVVLGCLSRTSTTNEDDFQERLVPNSWDDGLTGGTSAIPEPVLSDTETMAFDEERVAGRTGRILPAADVTWDIPGIHVAKPGGSPNFGSTDQSRDRCIVRIGHPIIFVECRHVPGDVRRNAGEKSSDITELFAGIIEAWNNQSHNFQPEALLMKPLNGVQHAVEPAAEFPIVPVAKALEVHLVEVDPGAQIVDDFRRSIPIRDVGGLQSLLASRRERPRRPTRW